MGSCLSAETRCSSPGSPSLGVKKRKNSKKRSTSRNSSFDYRREEPLHRVPGRIFSNGSSEVASLYSQQGKKGLNQDAMIVWENFGSRTDTIFCGVFDGHGPYGHMVAKRVRDMLPLKLSTHWEMNATSNDVLREINLNGANSMISEEAPFISADDESQASVDFDDTEKYPEVFQTLKESYLKSFKVMDRELKMHANIDCFCSGTTAVTFIKQGKHLVIGNVGDSRAVMGTRGKDNILTAVQLTVDLKPNLPAETERIHKCRGRVFALHDEPEVSRVWLPHSDSPGLAMARAFGDFCLKDFGLISVPEVYYRCLCDKDEFIVLATDGIWDVLTNEEVVDIVASASSRSFAARALVESAVRGWKYKYPTSKVDDCAVVCLFLDSDRYSSSTASSIKPKEQQSLLDLDHLITNKADSSTETTNKDHSNTVQTGKAIMQEQSEEEEEDKLALESGPEWSALEGVARVNTLLTLPRFVPGKEDNKPSGGTKPRK